MTFGLGDRFWEMLLDKLAGEAGPRDVKTLVDGFVPCVLHWTPCAHVEVGDEIYFHVHQVDAVGLGSSLWRG